MERLWIGMLALILGMSIPIFGSQLLRAQTAASAGSSSSLSDLDDHRSCTSSGTIFFGIRRPIDAINLFQQLASGVVAEREQILRDVTLWECFGGPDGIQPPPSPLLQSLASQLPGWHYKYTTDVAGLGMQTTYVPKPVYFESFASILMELEREYECKLAEFQPESVLTVRTDQDLDGPDGAANSAGSTYCCEKETYLCVDASAPDADGNLPECDPDRYQGPDPVCNTECTVSDHFDNFGIRIQNNFERMNRERKRARVAVKRSIITLRSLEMSVVFAVQMSCFQRAGVDIKNELALMADGTSCMPKIWDSVNSLHDLKSESPPEL
jgi:hypothetical protein